MVKMIQVWVTDDQFDQLKGKFRPHEVVTLLTLRKLGVEWDSQQDALDLQEARTRREMKTKPKKTKMRLQGGINTQGPMTVSEIASYLGVSNTQARRLVHQDKKLERVGTKNGAYLWGLGDN